MYHERQLIPSRRSKLIQFQEVEEVTELEERQGSWRRSEATSVSTGGDLRTDMDARGQGTACLCPPLIHTLKSCSQCDDIWEGGPWEVMGLDEFLRTGAPTKGVGALIRRGRGLVLSVSFEDTARGWPSVTQEASLPQNPTLRAPCSRIASLQSYEQLLVVEAVPCVMIC